VAFASLAISSFGLRRTSVASKQSMTHFWEIIAFLINSVIFLLIGLDLRLGDMVSSFFTIVLVFTILLAARGLMVFTIGVLADRKQGNLPWSWRHLIVWGGNGAQYQLPGVGSAGHLSGEE